MSVLTVGTNGQDFTTIAAAVAASGDGDTINVQAGVYNDDFFTIRHSLTLQAVGGEAHIVATTQPGDGKAAITESGANVAINGFEISGVTVPDTNGAAIRYEGGSLSLSDDYFHDNQEGLLGGVDPNGSISIDHSEIAHNGNDPFTGTHNLYIGAINQFTLTNSYIHDAIVGHEVKSRAANNTITGNRIFDNDGSASYSIDLPNGGNATISGNQIEQGPNTQNPAIIAYGEEGIAYSGSASIDNNVIVNDDGGRAVLAPSGGVSLTNNQLWNLPNRGDAATSGNVDLSSRPSLDTSSLSFVAASPPPSGSPPPTESPPVTPPPVEPPPVTPPPAFTPDQIVAWQNLVFTDFASYIGQGHTAIAFDPNTWTTLSAEMNDPLLGTAGIPSAAVWGPFQT